MIELMVGQSVEMEYGGKAKILKVLGSGGQGIVTLQTLTVSVMLSNGMMLIKFQIRRHSEKISKEIFMTVRQVINFFGRNI